MSKEKVAEAALHAAGSLARECTSDDGKLQCQRLGGECIVERDGYYWTSTVCVLVGAAVLLGYIMPKAKQLQALPAAAWRVSLEKTKHGHAS